MDYKRALWISIVAYISLLVLTIASVPLVGYEFSLNNPPMELYLFGIFASIVLMAFFTSWYFRSTTTQPSSHAGVMFGIVMLAVSSIGDLSLLIPLLISSPMAIDPVALYSNPLFWVMVGIIPITSGVTGAYIQKAGTAEPEKKTNTKKKKARTKRKTKK